MANAMKSSEIILCVAGALALLGYMAYRQFAPRQATGVEMDYSREIAAVDATITAALKPGLPRLAGPFKGGVAVLIGGSSAYWVHEGTVYAANGVAMSWSPGCQWSPAGVGFSEIQAALDVQP